MKQTAIIFAALLVATMALMPLVATAQQQIQKPTPEQAVSVLTQATAEFKGALADHQLIQASLAVFAETVDLYARQQTIIEQYRAEATID